MATPTAQTPKPCLAPPALPRPGARSITRDALIVILLATTLALVVNAMRTHGIPLVAEEEFEILVPCPYPTGEATAINADAALVRDPTSLLIDVRSRDGYEEWHLPHSLNQPFDWLAEQDEVNREAAEVARVIAQSGKHHVVVYGDGGDPDSGRHWAALLSTSGIRNVVFVSGGANALRQLSTLPGGRE